MGNPKTFTRQQRLNNECTHEEYYNQFVSESTIKQVVSWIGKKEIMKSTSDSFRDINLSSWDSVARQLNVSQLFRDLGDAPTLSGLVCVAKASARQFKLNQSIKC